MLAILAGVALPGCSVPVVPPIAAGVPGDAAFKAAIAERYRPGIPAGPLRAALAGEGFAIVVDPVRRRVSAVRGSANLPCYSQVRLEWTEDGRGRIVAITAERHDCT